MKLLYPTSTSLDLSALPTEVNAYPYEVDQNLPAEHEDAEVLVVWGNTPEMLEDAAARLRNLKWVQSLAAGPDKVLGAGFSSDITVTSGSGLHDRTVAEHALGLLLVAARRFHEMRDAQREKRWPGELGGVQPVKPKGNFRTLEDANVTVWGFGSIAQTLAPFLAMLGAKVTGVARSEGERAGFLVRSEADLAELLPQTDALVMILPSTDATKHALNAERLERLPAHAWLVNVGRGDTVDEAALIDALQKGTIAGAALDVFETEPLPGDSPLWDLPNAFISPHAAGGRPRGAADLVVKNVQRYLAGEKLENVVS